jgi:prepilin-type N-terminal cleavage/methylation domain-containing protein
MKRWYRIYYCGKSAFIDTFKTMNNRGVTLMELLIVVAIIGILAMAATTAYIGVMKKAARSEAYTNLESLRLLEEQFFSENAIYTISLGVPGNTVAIRDANLNDIQDTANAHPPDALRGFQPSGEANFSYRIIQNVSLLPPVAVPWDGATQNQDPCFIAVAEGITNTRVVGDIFAIDCNNNRNF